MLKYPSSAAITAASIFISPSPAASAFTFPPSAPFKIPLSLSKVLQSLYPRKFAKAQLLEWSVDNREELLKKRTLEVFVKEFSIMLKKKWKSTTRSLPCTAKFPCKRKQ